MNLLNLFKRKRKGFTAEHYYAVPVDEDVKAEQQHIQMLSGKPLQPVIVSTKPKQFIPDEHRTGGRIVKTMPAQLRHMKEIADKTDD